MTDDIVTRLRDRSWCWCKDHSVSSCDICSERADAADEIERLRNNINVLALELMRHENQAGPCKGTVDCNCGVSRIMHVALFKEVRDE